MRSSNQIVALTGCREVLESPEFREAQRFVSLELPQRLADTAEVQRLSEMNPLTGDYQAILTVANFFESMGLFVKNGIIDKRIACDFWSFIILRNWRVLAPFIELYRNRRGPAAWVYFEYLAMLATRHEAKHLNLYPPGEPRMPADTSLLNALAAEETKP
jgi:hypothetical protein